MTSNDWVAAAAKLKASLRNLGGQSGKLCKVLLRSGVVPAKTQTEHLWVQVRSVTDWDRLLRHIPVQIYSLGSWLFSESSRSALFWNITLRVVVIPCRRFGTTYRSRLQGSRNPRRKFFL